MVPDGLLISEFSPRWSFGLTHDTQRPQAVLPLLLSHPFYPSPWSGKEVAESVAAPAERPACHRSAQVNFAELAGWKQGLT